MIPTPIGASPSAATNLPGRQAADTNAQKSPPFALVNVGNAEFAQIPAHRSQEGAGASLWLPSDEAVDHFNSLPPEMREKIWNSLDAAGFSDMVKTSRGLAQEVTAAFRRLPEATKSALWLKARNEDQLGGVQFLIGNGINVEACDPNGNTPLFNAAVAGKYRLVHRLILAGANVNTVDVDGMPVLTAVIRSETENFEIFEALIKAGADVNVAY